MMFFVYLIFFIFGLIIGSFLNCFIYRLEVRKSSLTGRSYCPSCKHQLFWQDLIPIFSFIFLKGKCRYCAKKISWQYPLVELFTGILVVLVFVHLLPIVDYQSLVVNFIYLLLSVCFLLIIFVYDLKHFIIPDKVVFPAIGLALIYNLFDFKHLFYKTLPAALGALLFFLLIVLISKGKWMGVGDIKLAFLMGLLLGWPNILAALFFAFLMGAIIGIGLIVAKKKKLKSEVPFGPFLVTGTLIAMFWGERIISWYLNLFS